MTRTAIRVSRIKYLFRHIPKDFKQALLISVLWHLSLTLAGIIIEKTLWFIRNPDISYYPSDLLGHTMRWDSEWYAGITNGLYATDPSAPVFYPLFPLLVWIVRTLSFGLIGTATSGLIINVVSLSVTLWALRHISTIVIGKKSHIFVYIVLLTSAPAFFLHSFYGEGVFLAISSAAYLMFLKKKWLIGTLLLAALTASRLPSLLVVLLCFLEYARNYQWHIKKIINRNFLFLPIAFTGITAYSIYLKFLKDDALAMFNGYTIWSFQKFNPNFIETFFKALGTLFNGLRGITPYTNHELFVNFFLPIASLTVLLVCSIYAIKRIKNYGVPLGLSGLASFIFFTLNSNVNSVHRYVFTCLVVVLSISSATYSYKFIKQVMLPTFVYINVLLQAILYVLFISNYFAG